MSLTLYVAMAVNLPRPRSRPKEAAAERWEEGREREVEGVVRVEGVQMEAIVDGECEGERVGGIKGGKVVRFEGLLC